jgi:cobyrinic acid a,c-diamide synthase
MTSSGHPRRPAAAMDGASSAKASCGVTPRLFLSATHKSSGKTTITVGIAAAFAARGISVQTFKKGPDYIDPMWHSRVTGRPCFNLDFNTQSQEEIIATFAHNVQGAELALVEGNNGLHDGVDLEGSDSSAALAKVLKAPVVLVVDTSGVMRGIAPLVLGYVAFDPDVTIAGLILNKVGNARQEAKLRQAIERYTDIPVVGAIGRDDGLTLNERHLGLATPAESERIEQALAAIGRTVANALDLDRLLVLARQAPDLPAVCAPVSRGSMLPDVRIAVARDSAFSFYYPDDFAALERAGAQLCFFDTMADARLPEADGLFIGGGFPETHADRLQANGELREAIRNAIRDGLPTYAECGGLMYLARAITWLGRRSEMVGVVPADAVMYDKPQGHGLVTLEETAHAPWPDVDGNVRRAPIPAHEFHYARLENLDPNLRFAYRMRRGVGIGGSDGIVLGNMLAGFAHQRATACNNWASRFVAFARRHKQARAERAAATVDPSPGERMQTVERPIAGR